MILFRCLIESKYVCVQVSIVLESNYTFYCPVCEYICYAVKANRSNSRSDIHWEFFVSMP